MQFLCVIDLENHSFYTCFLHLYPCTNSPLIQFTPPLFFSSSSPPAPPPFDLGYLCFPGEWKGAVPPFRGSHPGHTGPRAVQHTEAGGPQTGRPSGSPWRVSASDHGHGRLCRQLHPNRHQLPAYVDSGQEQPASLRSPTPTRSSTIPSTTAATGTISIQWTVSGCSIIGLCSMSNCQTRTHLPSWFLSMPFCSHVWHLKLPQLPKYYVLHIVILSFIEPVYYDPTDYFDITQHEVDRQDELEYEVRGH